MELLLLLAVALAVAHQDRGAPPSEASRPRYSHASRVSPEVERRGLEWGRLRDAARQAERREDYPEAERLFREAAAYLWAPDPGLPGDLARLYDEQGREVDAFREYRLFYASAGRTSTDPVALAHYGDLCLKYAGADEAAPAYAQAATSKHRDPKVYEPDPEPRDRSLSALRATAYTAAGMSCVGHGDNPAAQPYLDRAVEADPSYWVARFYRAENERDLGRMAEAVLDAALAESLAPAAKQEWVLWMRSRNSIPDRSENLIPFRRFFKPDPESIRMSHITVPDPARRPIIPTQGVPMP